MIKCKLCGQPTSKGNRIDPFESAYWEAQERALWFVQEYADLVTFPAGCGVEQNT